MNWLSFLLLLIVPWGASFGGSLLAARMDLGDDRRQAAFLGFAAGVMVAASIWSLIIPAFVKACRAGVARRWPALALCWAVRACWRWIASCLTNALG